MAFIKYLFNVLISAIMESQERKAAMQIKYGMWY
jgi:hypothetical protein